MSADKTKPAGKNKSKSGWASVLLPYLVLIGSQIPLSLIYLKNLWARDHYLLMPLSLVAFGILVFLRWPRGADQSFYASTKSNVLFWVGIVLGVLGTFLTSPWMAFGSLLSFVASLLGRVNDSKVLGRMIPAVAPLVVLLKPPIAIDFDTVQGDIVLMQWINESATIFATCILDLLGFVHNTAGRRIEIPGIYFDPATINSGWYSVFTVLILTGIFLAAVRRPFFRSAALLVSAVWWVIFFSAIAMVLFVIGQMSFDIDFYGATWRPAIRITVVVGAFLMTLASDQLVYFLFGPIDVSSIDEDATYQNNLRKFWNKYIAGYQAPAIDINDKRQIAQHERRNRPPSMAVKSLLWVGMIGMGVMCAIQVIDIGRASLNLGNSILGSANAAHLSLDRDSMPATINGWEMVDFSFVEPTISTPFTVGENTWVYANSDDLQIRLIIKEPFPGWHDSVAGMEAQDWTVIAGPANFDTALSNDQVSKDSIETLFKNMMSDYCYSASDQLDGFGQPIQKPFTWTSPDKFLRRAIARVANRTRPRLFDQNGIEIQIQFERIGNIPEEAKRESRQFFQSAFRSAHETLWKPQSSDTASAKAP